MKKTIALFMIITLLLCTYSVSTNDTLIDSYPEENYSGYHTLTQFHPSSHAIESSASGQSFTCGSTAKIISVKFYLRKNNNPTGMAHALLYAHSGTYGSSSLPTGSPLATSDDFDITNLSKTVFQLITFNFTGAQQYEMQADTKYCIVFENPTSGYITFTNCVYASFDLSSPTHDGNNVIYRESEWQFVAGKDAIFYVYGEEPPNNPPTQSGEVPGNSSTGISITPDLYVLCNDADNDNLNATWWSNSSGPWLQFASNWTSFANNTNITQQFPNASAYSTTYYWSVNLTDGTDWTNKTYHFTTKVNTVPTQSNPFPANGSVDISVGGSSINVNLSDADSDTMNVTIWSNHTDSWVRYAWFLGDEAYNQFVNDFDGDGDWDLLDVVNWSNEYGWQLDGRRAFKDNRTVTHDWGMNDYITTYYWSVNVTDGTDWCNETYHFTTSEAPYSIDVDISPDAWSIGTLTTGTYAQNNYTFYQNGSAIIGITIGINDTNFTFVNYTTWSINGHDRYCANFTNNSWATEYMIEPGYPPTTLLNTSLGGNNNFIFSLRIWGPRSVTVNKREDFEVVTRAEEIT